MCPQWLGQTTVQGTAWLVQSTQRKTSPRLKISFTMASSIPNIQQRPLLRLLLLQCNDRAMSGHRTKKATAASRHMMGF